MTFLKKDELKTWALLFVREKNTLLYEETVMFPKIFYLKGERKMEDNKTMMEREADYEFDVENGENNSKKKLLIGALVVGGGLLLARAIYKKKIKPAITKMIREASKEEKEPHEAEYEECAEESKD